MSESEKAIESKKWFNMFKFMIDSKIYISGKDLQQQLINELNGYIKDCDKIIEDGN